MSIDKVVSGRQNTEGLPSMRIGKHRHQIQEGFRDVEERHVYDPKAFLRPHLVDFRVPRRRAR